MEERGLRPIKLNSLCELLAGCLFLLSLINSNPFIHQTKTKSCLFWFDELELLCWLRREKQAAHTEIIKKKEISFFLFVEWNENLKRKFTFFFIITADQWMNGMKNKNKIYFIFVFMKRMNWRPLAANKQRQSTFFFFWSNQPNQLKKVKFTFFIGCWLIKEKWKSWFGEGWAAFSSLSSITNQPPSTQTKKVWFCWLGWLNLFDWLKERRAAAPAAETATN